MNKKIRFLFAQVLIISLLVGMSSLSVSAMPTAGAASDKQDGPQMQAMVKEAMMKPEMKDMMMGMMQEMMMKPEMKDMMMGMMKEMMMKPEIKDMMMGMMKEMAMKPEAKTMTLSTSEAQQPLSANQPTQEPDHKADHDKHQQK